MQVDERSFRKALGCFATGVTVVTTADAEGQPVGLTVSSFSSLSLDPPLVLFCLDKRTRALEAFKSGHFAVHVLREDQRQLSIQFASRQDDKWNSVDFSTNDYGIPVLSNCLARLECELHEMVEGGDHTIFVGKVHSLEHQTGGQPLLYFRGAYANLTECF